MKSQAESLYVHIPFCEHICRYCDFSKVLFEEKWAFPYVQQLEKEILSFNISKGSLNTIYVGGGTPSCLPSSLLESLLSFLYPYLKEGGEFDLEGNPESLSLEKLLLIKKCGVNRLSIGVQSSDPALLAFMGRKHDFLMAKRSVEDAKKAGFDNISCDLIYGLPNESDATLAKDIDSLLSLDVDHLSTYCLSVSPGTYFYSHKVQEMDQNLAGGQYELILKRLREAGYDRYEVSNFARNGKKSRHNLVYWKDEQYYGAGLGASGYLGKTRYTNTKNLDSYLKGGREGSKDVLDEKGELEDYFLTNLRLEEGFSLKSFKERFGFEFAERYHEALKKPLQEGLAVFGPDSFKATDKGILLLDRLLLALY